MCKHYNIEAHIIPNHIQWICKDCKKTVEHTLTCIHKNTFMRLDHLGYFGLFCDDCLSYITKDVSLFKLIIAYLINFPRIIKFKIERL